MSFLSIFYLCSSVDDISRSILSNIFVIAILSILWCLYQGVPTGPGLLDPVGTPNERKRNKQRKFQKKITVPVS